MFIVQKQHLHNIAQIYKFILKNAKTPLAKMQEVFFLIYSETLLLCISILGKILR